VGFGGFEALDFTVKSGSGDRTEFQHVVKWYFFVHPAVDELIEVIRHDLAGPSENHTSRFGRTNTLGLTSPYRIAFALRDERQYLKCDIRDKGYDEVFTLACIEERHIEDADVNLEVFGEVAPLVLNLLVVTAETINAFDINKVALLQPANKPLVRGTFEILAGLFVDVNHFARNTELREREYLPRFILICG